MNGISLAKELKKKSIYYFVCWIGQEDPRYDSEKSAVEMRRTIIALGKNTHKFIKEHNNMCRKVEDIKYKDYMEQRFNYRSGQSGDAFVK